MRFLTIFISFLLSSYTFGQIAFYQQYTDAGDYFGQGIVDVSRFSEGMYLINVLDDEAVIGVHRLQAAH